MEKFDLVNQDDMVVGVTNKPEAHSKKLPHRIAVVYVFDSKGRLCVQIHKKSGGKYDHSVGGHVTKGEAYAEAAAREAREELGIEQPLTEVATGYYSDEVEFIHIYGIYECTVSDDWKFEPNDEVEEIVFMPIKDTIELAQASSEKLTGGFRSTLPEYCRIKGIPTV